jgi:hypothetical protein
MILLARDSLDFMPCDKPDIFVVFILSAVNRAQTEFDEVSGKLATVGDEIQ